MADIIVEDQTKKLAEIHIVANDGGEDGGDEHNNDNDGGREAVVSIATDPLSKMPAELLEKIFAHLDYDSLDNLVGLSRKIHAVAAPMFHKIRHQIMDVIIDWPSPHNLFSEASGVLYEKEKFLKRVLRTNEDLTLLAHNLPIGGGEGDMERGRMWTRNVFRIGTNWADQSDPAELDRRAADLATISVHHCHGFPDSNFRDIRAELEQITKISEAAYTKLYNCLLFKDFIRKYPILSGYTSVQWPEGMGEDARTRMAMAYAQGIERRAPSGPSKHGSGRMYAMRNHGSVSTAPPSDARFRPYPSYSGRQRDIHTF